MPHFLGDTTPVFVFMLENQNSRSHIKIKEDGVDKIPHLKLGLQKSDPTRASDPKLLRETRTRLGSIRSRHELTD